MISPQAAKAPRPLLEQHGGRWRAGRQADQASPPKCQMISVFGDDLRVPLPVGGMVRHWTGVSRAFSNRGCRCHDYQSARIRRMTGRTYQTVYARPTGRFVYASEPAFHPDYAQMASAVSVNGQEMTLRCPVGTILLYRGYPPDTSVRQEKCCRKPPALCRGKGKAEGRPVASRGGAASPEKWLARMEVCNGASGGSTVYLAWMQYLLFCSPPNRC